MKFGTFATIAIGLSLTAIPHTALAQKAELTARVSVDLKDAPTREAIEAIFKQAGIQNYVIDNNVAGFVTLKLTEQPLENTLKLFMRASSQPLTYTIENGVWIVKPRISVLSPALSAPEAPVLQAPSGPHYERINLTYLDPADLEQLLGGVITIPSFTRQRGGQGFSSGNGLIGTGGGAGLLGQTGNGMSGIGASQLGAGRGQSGFGMGQPGMGNNMLGSGSGSGFGQRYGR